MSPSPEQIARFQKYVRATEETLEQLKDSIENEEWDGVHTDAHRLADDAQTLRHQLTLLEEDPDA